MPHAMIKTPFFTSVPVLLVEELPFVRRTIRGMLEQVNLRQIHEAEDSSAALARLMRFRPELIILDWDLPEEGSAQLLSLVRDPDQSNDSRVPIILTSMRPTRRLVDHASTHGIRHVLAKPFSPKALWIRIADMIPMADPSEASMIRLQNPPADRTSLAGD